MFLWHDISSITSDFRDNRLTVLNASYKKLSMDGDWEGLLLAPACLVAKFSTICWFILNQ